MVESEGASSAFASPVTATVVTEKARSGASFGGFHRTRLTGFNPTRAAASRGDLRARRRASCKTLGSNNVVVDIERAGETLRAELGALAFKNLDEMPEFRGVNTTTEYLARFIFDRMASANRTSIRVAGRVKDATDRLA